MITSVRHVGDRDPAMGTAAGAHADRRVPVDHIAQIVDSGSAGRRKPPPLWRTATPSLPRHPQTWTVVVGGDGFGLMQHTLHPVTG